MKNKWAVYENDGLIEVIPIDEKVDHIPEDYCTCKPTMEKNGRLIIHNSYDYREAVEEAKEILKRCVK